MPVRAISSACSFAIQSLPPRVGVAEFVERRVEAVADHAALFHGERRVIHDGARNQFHEVGRFGELGFNSSIKQVRACACHSSGAADVRRL